MSNTVSVSSLRVVTLRDDLVSKLLFQVMRTDNGLKFVPGDVVSTESGKMSIGPAHTDAIMLLTCNQSIIFRANVKYTV
jgi:hypothetical protein